MGALQIISYSGQAFRDREEAGRLLSAELDEFAGSTTVVLGIPRGGMVIAQSVATELEVDLDIVLSHKLGAPMNPELAVGAVCEDGTVFINKEIAPLVGANTAYIEREKSYQSAEIARRVKLYRAVVEKLSLEGRVVILADDGVATGATMQAALWAVRQEGAERIILAVPVGPEDTVRKLAEDADVTVCLRMPAYFAALGRFYLDFGQVEDEQLLEILEYERRRRTEQ